jgi:hypothetical protein
MLTPPVCAVSFGATLLPFFLRMFIDHPQHGAWYLAEDFACSKRMQQAGAKIFADTTVRLTQIGNFGCSWEQVDAPPRRRRTYTPNAKTAKILGHLRQRDALAASLDSVPFLS